MAEIADLAKKNRALRERVTDLEAKLEHTTDKLEDLQDVVNSTHAKLLKARKELTEKKTRSFDMDPECIERVGEHRVVPAAHFMPGNKRRIPDDAAARCRHCLLIKEYNIHIDYAGYLDGDFQGLAQRVLFAVYQKGFFFAFLFSFVF